MLPIDFDLIGTLEQINENESAPRLLYCFSMLRNTHSTIAEIVQTFESLKISFLKDPTKDSENVIRMKMNKWNQFAVLHRLGSIHEEETVSKLFIHFTHPKN